MQNQFQIAQIPFLNTVIKYNKLAKGPYDKDIIPGVYEGGFKVWECTLDLLKYIAEVQTQINLNNINNGKINDSNGVPNSIIAKLDMRNKVVMDIGCGHGLLGIAAIKSGASCCIFQDYNKQVLKSITNQNILINDVASNKCSFMAGDWDFLQLINSNNVGSNKNSNSSINKVDIMIGSQITYKQENYQKIVRLIKKYLKEDGIAVFANKCYYFGVGGNLDDFQQVVLKESLGYCSLLKICPVKGGNKKQIIAIYNNKQTQMQPQM